MTDFSDSKSSVRTHSSGFSKTAPLNQQVFTNVARYKGALVAIKYINKATLVVTKEIIDEINNVSPDLKWSLKCNRGKVSVMSLRQLKLELL